MIHDEERKQERIYVTLDRLSKRKLEQASASANQSLSEFILEPPQNLGRFTMATLRSDAPNSLKAWRFPRQPTPCDVRTYGVHFEGQKEIASMANTETIKQQRMHIRLDSLSKQKLERAAAYVHKSLSEFVLVQALHAADEVILEHETLTLTQADWGVFLDALENPPKPSAKLKRAFAEHKKRVQQ